MTARGDVTSGTRSYRSRGSLAEDRQREPEEEGRGRQWGALGRVGSLAPDVREGPKAIGRKCRQRLEAVRVTSSCTSSLWLRRGEVRPEIQSTASRSGKTRSTGLDVSPSTRPGSGRGRAGSVRMRLDLHGLSCISLNCIYTPTSAARAPIVVALHGHVHHSFACFAAGGVLYPRPALRAPPEWYD